MQTVPEGYTEAVASADRTVDIYLSIGTGIDTTAADDLTAISGSFLPLSNTGQATDAVYYITSELATFEGYGIKTSADAGILAPPITSVHYPPEAGLWSDILSGEDGTVDFTVGLTFSEEHSSALRIYTDGPAVLEASATFTDADGTATVKEFACASGYIQIKEVMSYTAISISITKVDGAYRHVRLAEIEFGASISLSKTDLGGEITVIRETDPTELSAPMDELDLTIINVSGDFDPDSPAGRLSELKIGYPLWLSFTVNDADGKRYTMPCGRYYIGERDASDTRLELTAFDARFPLSELYVAWSISASESLGQTIDDLLSTYDVPHIVDEDLYSLMPDGSYTFDDQSTIADDLLSIEQAYAIYFLPDRQGSIKVTQTWPSDTYGTIPTSTLYTWPAPKQTSRYNYVQIGYKITSESVETIEYVDLDLRTDTTEGKTVLQISGNPLITSQARATAVATRLAGRIYSEETETEWRGDPAMDLMDSASVPGRWTQESPQTYVATRIEETYDGTYRATMRGMR